MDDQSHRQPVVMVASSRPPGDIQCLVNRNGRLKFNTLSHWQPTKLPQDGRGISHKNTEGYTITDDT